MTAPRLGPGLWTARAIGGSIRPQPLPPSYTTTGDTNMHTVRYTELTPDRFKGFWED